MPADFAIGPSRKRRKPDRVTQAVKAVRAASSGPRTDAQTSGRNYGVRKADRFKQTRPYRQAVEAAVRSQPAAVRAQRVNQVAGRVKAGKYTGHTPIEDLVVARRSDRLAKAYAGPKGKERQRKIDLQRRYTHTGPAQRAVATDYKPPGLIEQAILSAIPEQIKNVPIVGSATTGVLEATYHDPIGVPSKTATGLVDIASATPAAVAQLVGGIGVPFATGHPGTAGRNALGVLKQAAADYSRRYGPLLEGEAGRQEYIKRIREEGAAPEALDAFGVVASGGAIAGRALGAAARTGRLGERLERVATEPRPELRVAPGVSRPQELSPNLFKAAAAKRLDQARVSRNAKQTVRAVARGEAGPVQPEPGTVRPLSRTLEKREQRKEVSKDQSRAYLNQRREFKKEIAEGAQHDLVRLSRTEQDAVFHTVQGVLPIHGTGRQIRQAAERRLKQIYGEREGRLIERAMANSGIDEDTAHTARMLVRRARERGTGEPTVEGLVADLKRDKAPDVVIRTVEASAPALKEALKDPRALIDRGEIATLRRIRDNADTLAGSQKLKDFQASHLERSKRLEADDPALQDAQALARRYGPQGELLGVPNPRLPGTVRRNVKVAKAKVTQAERRVARADTAIRRAERHERRQLGRVDVRATQADAKTLRADKEYRTAAQAYAKAGREFRDAKKAFGNAHRNPDLYTKPERVAIEQRAQKAQQDLEAKRAAFNTAKSSVTERAAKAATEAAGKGEKASGLGRLGNAPARPLDSLERKRSTLQEAQLEKEAAEADLKAARDGVREAQRPGSSTVDIDENLKGPDREEARNKAYADAEEKALRDWVEEVKAKAKQAGLPEPAYLRHQRDSRFRLGLRTTGSIASASALTHRSDLELFQQGRATTHPGVLLEGLGANVKRKHQWKAVGDVFDKYTYQWARNKSGKDILEEIYDRKLDPSDFLLIDTKKFREIQEADKPGDETVNVDPVLHQALIEAVTPLGKTKTGLRTLAQMQKQNPGEVEKWLNTSGFALVDKGIGEELLAGASPAGVTGRVFGKVQGIQSAALLGLSPSWLMMQVGANTLATTFGNKGALADVLKGSRLYKQLSQEERDQLDTFGGVGVLEAHTGQHIGSVIDTPSVRSARQMGTTRIGVALRHMSPVKLMFLADDAQNRAFRRGVLTNRLKREAFRRIRQESGRMAEAMARMEQLLKVGPTDSVFKQVRAVLENPKDVERLAQSVNNVLGDFTRYTVRERRSLKNFVMFYGFIRYALKTAFYTMPVKHPIMGAIAAKLGQLHVEEVKELLGGEAAPWAYSRIFFDAGGGKLVSIDTARLNPVTSPLTGLVSEGPKAALGLTSPLFQAVSDQVYGGVGFEGGRGFKVGGSAEENRNPDAVTRGRIFLGQTSGALFPVRLAEQLTQGGGRQGDDTLLFSQRPIQYKSAEAIARNEERISRHGSKTSILLQQIIPFLPRPDYSRDANGLGNDGSSAGPSLQGLSNWERQQIREAAKQAQQGPQLSNWERDQIRRALSGGG